MQDSARLQVLVQRFADAVAAQTGAIMRGDARGGNRHAKRYIACFRKLMTYGDEGVKELAALFAHSDADVRSMAATFLLRRRTTEALAVLRSVACGSGLVAFEASEAIKRWEEGTWSLDP